MFERILGFFKYVRNLIIPGNINMPRVLNFQIYTGFTYFRKRDSFLNRHRDAIMEGLLMFQDTQYSRFLHIQA